MRYILSLNKPPYNVADNYGGKHTPEYDLKLLLVTFNNRIGGVSVGKFHCPDYVEQVCEAENRCDIWCHSNNTVSILMIGVLERRYLHLTGLKPVNLFIYISYRSF